MSGSGERCGRVLVDCGDMGLDAMTCHVEITHPHVLAAWRIAQRIGRSPHAPESAPQTA
ncbi:hypothetical protein [Saccharopolyspora mangrovi]|uniref:Uncharacterized protein n=1 Tax=Saccharopolyspora mangrovi TaxID=3082379 RepID=A0ABU6A3C7_9PSEU|nr:hypothetical protein [Saccharopolyspora sp. S2-29]MEB3366042.1 hypothetical protein [Saccharopolyspora sp. S2-29]